MKSRLCLLLLTVVVGHFGLDMGEAFSKVLCFGGDGHVAIEDADHRQERGEGIDIYAKSHASPCNDLPVATGDHQDHTSLPSLTGKSLFSLAVLVATHFASLGLLPAESPIFVAASDQPLGNSTLDSLHTVVLLI